MTLLHRSRRFSKTVSFGEDPYSSLRFIIEERKLEVREKFKQLRDDLDYKEEELIKDLNIILDKYSPKEYKLHNGVKTHPHIIPEFKISWNIDEWRAKLYKICKLESVYSPFIHKKFPLRTGVNQDSVRFSEPRGLAVDRITQEIYLANHGADSIVVLDINCDLLKTIRNTDLCGPWSLCLDDMNLYVACSSHTLLKIDKITGLVLACVNLSDFMTGVTVDDNSNRVYGCEFETRSICVYTKGLVLEKKIVLHSRYFTHNTRINDIKILKEQICCLFQNSTYHLQMFSMTGELIKGLVEQSNIVRGNCFCMDWSSKYFLISDGAESKIKVFSEEGQYLHDIGVMCCTTSLPGTLSEPTGVAISTGNRVVVCDQKVFYSLQIF
ncbi:hypothetical protein LOD99_3292 [Oopsacas minuta]|uniref:Uncharacterized protein n=1 Tax=Oopsacas minuta TaxID=111878 RepID=A0AAV7JXT5_9METZ|nr:hypothetical protein LOD99_3292 [Oopsacas minuta]